MKRVLFWTILFSVLTTGSYAQWLSQSAEGKGTFLFKGTNVTLDLAKTAFSFTLNNMNRPVDLDSIKNRNKFFLGGKS